ncbi:MAG: NAD(P)-dependent oxidoreductase [Alphaproteobacteria bacterium]
MAEPARPAVGFVGLGRMGLPMAGRLVAAGFDVRGADLAESRRAAFAGAGGAAFADPRAAAEGTAVLVTMLPDAGVVADALVGTGAAADALAAGALVVDMSSSAPLRTRALGDRLAGRGIALIDAPVSGGVPRAVDGTLAIMAGGEARDIDRAQPLFDCMGTVFRTGPLGSGHAMKALNNYVSAAGLVAACEALRVARAFGLEPETAVDVLNSSTGRNNSTERKLKPFVLPRNYASGFSMALMAKDIRTAADLAASLGLALDDIERAAALWEQASRSLGPDADHTAIDRYLAGWEPQ